MKDIASVDYIADEIDMFEDDGLCHSTNSLKMIMDTADDESNFIEHRASSNSNLSKIVDKEATISHARSENMIPILKNKKNRLISTDSGFGSYGPCDIFNSGSVDNVIYFPSGPKHTTNHIRPNLSATTYQETTDKTESDQTESDDKISPLLSETAAAQSTPKIKQHHESIDTNKKIIRNTSISNTDDNFELDPRLINRDDGFHEIQCYVDEHGSPVVREKRRARRKSTLREELKARSLGASFDENLLRNNTNKTPTCVSFSRLFKKLRETFCKLLLLLFF